MAAVRTRRPVTVDCGRASTVQQETTRVGYYSRQTSLITLNPLLALNLSEKLQYTRLAFNTI